MITRFKGKYDFLSNFHPVPIRLDGELYPSVEHAFQAAKTLDLEEHRYFMFTDSPKKAKRFGKKVHLRNDWEEVKLDVMEGLIRQKFEYSDFRQKLIDTGDEDIIETNTWNDTFWGVCNNVGENHLGKIIMRIRDELKRREMSKC